MAIEFSEEGLKKFLKSRGASNTQIPSNFSDGTSKLNPGGPTPFAGQSPLNPGGPVSFPGRSPASFSNVEPPVTSVDDAAARAPQPASTNPRGSAPQPDNTGGTNRADLTAQLGDLNEQLTDAQAQLNQNQSNNLNALSTLIDSGLTERSARAALGLTESGTENRELIDRVAQGDIPSDIRRRVDFVGASDSVAASSDAAKSQEDDVVTSVSDLEAGFESDIARRQQVSQQIDDLISAREDELNQRREQEVAGIRASFEEEERQTEDAQRREKGAFTVGLATIGGYLGQSASSLGAMRNLNKQHNLEMASLEAKKQSAIQEARNAISDKQFALAQMRVEEVRDLDKSIRERSQQHFDNLISLSNKQQEAEEFRLKVSESRRKAQEPFINVSREAGVLGVMQQGIVDPTEIFDIVNFTADGTQVGDMTIEEIRDIIDDVREGRVAHMPDVIVKTNEAGQLTGTDKYTGELLWRTEAGRGRSGTSSPNLSVSPIANSQTGQLEYVQVIDRDTGTIKYVNPTTGEEVDPSSVQIGESADPLEQYIDSIIIDSLSDLPEPDNQ